MKQSMVSILVLFLALNLSACGAAGELNASPAPAAREAATVQPTREPEDSPAPTQELREANPDEEEEIMRMKIADTVVSVEWENNESVDALRALAAEEPLTISMSMYGGFEQVGAIGRSLPRNDVQTTTAAGDVVLYSGNQIVVFYGSNSWAYTRLGHITDKTAAQMAELLGNGDVTVCIGKEFGT